MPRPFPLLALLLVGALLAVAGCGGGDGGSDSSSGGSTPSPASNGYGGGSATTTETTPQDAGGATGPVAVAMRDFAFAPKTVRVKVGQKIEWSNDDSTDHNVVATSGASFRSGDFGGGGTYDYTPTRAGTIDYVCTLHPGMDGTVVVTQ